MASETWRVSHGSNCVRAEKGLFFTTPEDCNCGLETFMASAQRIKELEEVLRKYSQHKKGCERYLKSHLGIYGRCTCGLSTALASLLSPEVSALPATRPEA